LLAIANALEGMTRAEAARLAGMERQALHDAIQRFNAEGPDGLHDRHRTGRPEQLTAGQQAALKAHKRLNLSCQKTRPSHPKGNPAAPAAFKKGAAVNAADPRGGAS
jgi:hypothetical protein